MENRIVRTFVAAIAIGAFLANSALACTGITLKAKDGAVVFGRTLEWGAFDLHSRLVIVPRGQEYRGETPEGLNGLGWKGSTAQLASMRSRRISSSTA